MAVEKALKQTRIREVKPQRPPSVERGATLAEAINSMRGRGAGCVLVCEGGRMAGILTERDVLNKIIGEQTRMDSPVEEFMTPAPRTLTSDDLLGDAIRLMDEGGYRHVPVVDGSGRVEGVLSIQRIIEFLAELFPEEVLNLPPRPNQYMDSREGG
jgi:CBS domain-containing protein